MISVVSITVDHNCMQIMKTINVIALKHNQKS